MKRIAFAAAYDDDDKGSVEHKHRHSHSIRGQSCSKGERGKTYHFSRHVDPMSQTWHGNTSAPFASQIPPERPYPFHPSPSHEPALAASYTSNAPCPAVNFNRRVVRSKHDLGPQVVQTASYGEGFADSHLGSSEMGGPPVSRSLFPSLKADADVVRRAPPDGQVVPSDVFVSVYHLGMVSSHINKLARAFRAGAFHVGVEVYGVEYWFGGSDEPGSGITPDWPKQNPDFVYDESIYMGRTNVSELQVAQMIENMGSIWDGRTYSLLDRNCIDFADAFCVALGVGNVPFSLKKLPKSLAATRKVLGFGKPQKNRGLLQSE